MLHGSIGQLQRDGYRLLASCNDPACLHTGQIDLARLVARFGPDFLYVEQRPALLASLTCSKCGGKQMGITVMPPSGYRT